MHHPKNHPPLIFISAGEASGDYLAADLVQSMLAQQPELQFIGIAGKRMQKAGVKCLFDDSRFAIIGLWEIFKNLRLILQAFKKIQHFFKTQKPDLVILVDLPGTNLRLAHYAKKYNIPVFYYVSPQIWAWRYGRIKKIKKRVDHMAVLFSFEKNLYQKENIPVTFVGHPLIRTSQPTLSKAEAFEHFQLNPNQPVLALLPGSRTQEIQRIFPTIIKSCEHIKEQIPNIQLVLPLAKTLAKEQLQPWLRDDIKIIHDPLANILPICDAAIAVSGTVTLELGLHQVPMVIIYKVAALTYWAGRCLIDANQCIGLCNIVAEKKIIKEFIQHAASEEAITTEILQILTNADYRNAMRNALGVIKQNLSNQDLQHAPHHTAMHLLNH